MFCNSLFEDFNKELLYILIMITVVTNSLVGQNVTICGHVTDSTSRGDDKGKYCTLPNSINLENKH